MPIKGIVSPLAILAWASVVFGLGCQREGRCTVEELAVRCAIERYAACQAERMACPDRPPGPGPRGGDALGVSAGPLVNGGRPVGACRPGIFRHQKWWSDFTVASDPSEPETAMTACRLAGGDETSTESAFTLGTFGYSEPPTTQSTQPTSAPFVLPDGYWRSDIWHQMGHESWALARHDLWHGFKTSFWDLENALLLTAAMGASITLRETGVDDTIRNRTHGSRALGDMSETIQILGHPGTHFGAAGVLWLTSTLTKDAKEHEVAKALTQALAVNGITTVLLKVSTNTRAPDGSRFAWPSGHTSSAFAAAAVLNEYYGPWVGIPSLALAGLVGYQRLDSRVHDFSDVVFGAMLGYVIGTSIAKDDKAQFPELFGMKVVPYVEPESGATGLALLKRW